MSEKLIKKLRDSAQGWDECGHHEDAKQDRDAADRIEHLANEVHLWSKMVHEATLSIERLIDLIGWLEDKLAAIQYTNLRRDMNAKNRTATIEAICKEKRKQDEQ